MDINLGQNSYTKLVIYEGDDPLLIVDSFTQLHNLNEKKRQKLLVAVHYQMSRFLTKIEEIGEDEQEDE